MCLFLPLGASDQDQSRQTQRPLSIRARAHESLSFILHFSSMLGRPRCVFKLQLLHCDPCVPIALIVRAIRGQRAAQDEEAANQERDEIKAALIEILRCIRESNTGPSQPGTQYSESSNTTTPQCSGALGTTNTTTTQTTVTTTTTITTAGADAPAGIEVVSSGPAPEGHQQPSNPDDSESDSELYRLSIGELVRLVMREARELRNSRKGMMLLFISKNNG